MYAIVHKSPFLVSVATTPHQRGLFTANGDHNRKKNVKKSEINWGNSSTDIATSKLVHLWLREHHKRLNDFKRKKSVKMYLIEMAPETKSE